MNKQDIKIHKAEFINLLKSTDREGIDDLIDMLDDGKMRFFTAPASVNHHLNTDGGLLLHSLYTCKAGLKLREMVIALNPDLEHKLKKDSVIIATLLHDICKADIYFPTLKKRKGENGLCDDVPDGMSKGTKTADGSEKSNGESLIDYAENGEKTSQIRFLLSG